MVYLSRIYTRSGDQGQTSLGNGVRVDKHALRVEAYGTVDEANAVFGLARLHLPADAADIAAMLARVQNDLFDLGADLCTPEQADPPCPPLRIVAGQVARLEQEIDVLNARLPPLASFILPGGTAAAAHLHQARTVIRRAERLMTALQAQEPVNPEAIRYGNRLSDHAFVLARYLNHQAGGDVLWVPGGNRP